MNLKTRVVSFLIVLLLSACSAKPELLANNNPNHYSVAQDVLWASADGIDLTMDIYTPTSGAGPYPVIVMFHGGGWLINNKSIMDQSAKYLVSNAQYVVCNVNYRLLTDNNNSVTLNEIVDDVFGSVLWIKDQIKLYLGDPARIIVTGDSAGAHLSAMVVNSGTQLSVRSDFLASQSFTPSFIPAHMSAEQLVQPGALDVQAAVLNYGAFNLYESSLRGFESWRNPFWFMGGVMPRGLFGENYNVLDQPQLYKAVSPALTIPDASQRKLPPMLITRGSEDGLITSDAVLGYIRQLESSGHKAQFWEHKGRGHAYLDSGSNMMLGMNFEDDAPLALDVMIAFLDNIFYP